MTILLKHKNILEDDKLLMLTKSEIKLLDLLVKYKGSIVTYQQIEHVVWYERMMTGDALRAVVCTLRKKMGEDIIYNITGVGYLLR